MTQAPVADFDPFDPDYVRDPYPSFARLRAETPIAYAPAIDAYIVSKFEDIDQVLRDHQTFSSSEIYRSFVHLDSRAATILRTKLGPNVTVACDPPRHTEVRKHNMRVMSARRLAMLEPQVRARTRELLESFRKGEPIELSEALAFPLPALTIFTLLGFPPEDCEMLKNWSGDRLILIGGRPDAEEQLRIAEQMEKYWNYCADFVAERASERKDDLTSDLLDISHNNPEIISHMDVTSIIFGISTAGHETTTNLILNLMRQLLLDRPRWEAIVADPSLTPAAVEEGLRYDSSGISVFRRTTRDTMIRGIDIPANALVICLLASGSRDEEAFENADQFDMHRRDGRRHLGFGRGIHLCLGNTLARMEVRVAIEELASHFPSIALDMSRELRYPENISFRGPQELWVVP